MVQDPILIMATPRSGSSMVAGLFAAHGVWAGTCREANNYNPTGYFENLAIKQLITGRVRGQRWHKAIVHKGVLAQRMKGFRDVVEQAIEDDGYRGGPWLWKGSALYWPAFFEFTPKWVCVKRDAGVTAESCEKSRMLATADTEGNIRFHHDQMHHLETEFGARTVDSEAVVRGDDATLRAAMEHCGIDYDPEITKDFVRPSAWHYWSS